jgi:hypothetical protein
VRAAVAASGLGIVIAIAIAGLVDACSSSTSPEGSGLDDASVVSPGCLPTPNASCAPYSAGARCPGSSLTCVSCGPGSYTFAASICTCGSAGTWSCAPPSAGAVTCASPVGQYVDPTCTILYPGDAAVDEVDGAPGIDAGAVDAGADAGIDGGSDAGAELDATDGSDADEDASG